MASNILIYFTGQTPLLSAVMNNQTEVVRFLADNGADPNLQCKSFQFTPSLKKKDIGNSLNIICHVHCRPYVLVRWVWIFCKKWIWERTTYARQTNDTSFERPGCWRQNMSITATLLFLLSVLFYLTVLFWKIKKVSIQRTVHLKNLMWAMKLCTISIKSTVWKNWHYIANSFWWVSMSTGIVATF